MTRSGSVAAGKDIGARTMLKPAVRIVVTFALMWVCGSTVLAPRLDDSGVSVFYLPVATLFFCLFLSRSRSEALSYIAAFLAAAITWVAIDGHSIADSLAFLAVDVAEAGTLATLLRRFGTRSLSLSHPDHVLIFIALTLGVTAVFAGVATMVAHGLNGDAVIQGVDPGRVWRDWFFGDVTAYFTLGAGLLIWRRLRVQRARQVIQARPVAFTVSVTLLILAVLYDFEVIPAIEGLLLGTTATGAAPHPALIFLTLPAVIWLSFTFTQIGASIGILITSVPSIHMVAAGFGPRWLAETADRVFILQCYVGISALVAFLVAALAYQLRRRERLLERAYAVARRRARDRADFLSTFDHEIRTPLNGILGFTELMLSEIDGPLSPRYRDYVRIIDQSSKRLLHLSTEVLSLRRMQPGAFEIDLSDLNPRKVAEDVMRMLAGVAERRQITVVNDIPADLSLRASEIGLRHALANILSNALRHTPALGRVTVSATASRHDVVIEVTDTGSGFVPEAVREHGRLQRGDQRAGLGLQITDTILSLHDGRLVVASRPGQGTAVRFVFPRNRSGREPTPRVHMRE